MEWISSRAIYIGVGIFVTIAIVTGVIMAFTTVGDMYGQVSNLNISIKDEFDNIYSKYSGATLNGVGLINTIKKYEQDDGILVTYTDRVIITENVAYRDGIKREIEVLIDEMEKRDKFKYEQQYSTNVENDGNKTVINFELI